MVTPKTHHSLFCRTLRVMSEGGFFTTIHSMIVVAADKAYLVLIVSKGASIQGGIVGGAAGICLTSIYPRTEFII